MATHFTKKEIEEIRQGLLALALRDTDFEKIEQLSDDDIVAVVKGGLNKKITIKDLNKSLLDILFNSELLEQYIDYTPTEGSNKLVSSGGVYNAINGDNIIDTRQIKDGAVKGEKLSSNSVTSDKIKDANVTWDKFDDNTKNIISTGGGQHGIPLTGEFGDSNELGITQRALTESRDDLQNQIDEIVATNINISLTSNVSAILVGESTTVNLTASMTSTIIDKAEEIQIKKGDTVLVTQDNVASLSGSSSETPSSTGTISYKAVFTINGKNRETSRNVSAVYPVYYGGGDAYTDVIDDAHRASARTSPNGTYNITTQQNGKYLWFVVPATMIIHGATWNGFEFPLMAPTNVTINDIAYKSYRSESTQDAGTFNIVIS